MGGGSSPLRRIWESPAKRGFFSSSGLSGPEVAQLFVTRRYTPAHPCRPRRPSRRSVAGRRRYFQTYKLAYDLAKRAEGCFRFELRVPDSSYVNFGYWDELKNGLMAGERLQYDLRRLETAYLEQDRREFELTKHVSLALLTLGPGQAARDGPLLLPPPGRTVDLDLIDHAREASPYKSVRSGIP